MDFSGFVNVGYCELLTLPRHLSGYHSLPMISGCPSWGKVLRFDTFKKQQYKRRHSRRRSLIIFCREQYRNFRKYFLLCYASLTGSCKTKEYGIGWFIEDFLEVVWFGSLPTPSPPPREQVIFLSQSSCVSLLELTDGRGFARSQIVRPREGLALYK